MKHLRRQRTCMILLCETTANIGDQRISYRLFVRLRRGKRDFSMRIRMNGEQSEIHLGDCAEAAFVFYKRMYNGLVTPCALQELFEDFCYELRFPDGKK